MRTLTLKLLLLSLATTLCYAAPPQAAKKAAAKRAPAASYQEIQFPPLKQIQIPEVETITLPNGLRLYLLEDHTLPIITGRALLRTGNLFDPPEKIGLAGMTGSVMRTGGTTSKTGDELDQELESMAASVEAGIGETEGQANFFSLKENVDRVLPIYADVLMNPAFRQERIDLYKNQARSAISRRNDEAGSIARREFANLIYGRDNPYGWQMEYEHLDRIERDDLVQFHRRYFFPGNVMLAIYGDFSAPEMRTKIEAVFQEWNNPQPPVPPFPPVRSSFQPGVYYAVKEDVNQATIRMGHLGGVLKDPDYPALEVMADILGGGFPSRLFRNVRTRMGYAYSVGSSWGAGYNHPGLFVAASSTKSESAVKAIEAIRAEIERIRKEEVTEAELRTAKDTVLNGFVFNFDTKAKTLGRLLTYEYWGYPKDFIFQYQKQLAAVTRQDVLRVAQKYLRPDQMALVVVGKPADFDQPLSSLGLPVTELDIRIPEPKQERTEANAESLKRGRAALVRAQQALGGADKLAALRDASYSASAQLTGPMGNLAVKQRVRVIFPGVLRQETELPFGKIEVYTDGKTGWLQSPQGQNPLPAPQMQQARGELFRMTETLLLSDRDSGRTVNFVRQDKVGDREADVVEIAAPDGPLVTVYIDSASGAVLKKDYQGQAMTGSPAKVEEIYEDFREVSGVRVPFKIVILQNGNKFAETQITEFQYNTGLREEDLAKP
jgi:zinc protease